MNESSFFLILLSVCLIFSSWAADRYLGLKSKCGTIAPGPAEVCGAEAGTVPSRGSGRSSDSRRQTDQGARRAMGPEYGGEPEPLWRDDNAGVRAACWVCSSQPCPARGAAFEAFAAPLPALPFRIKGCCFVRVRGLTLFICLFSCTLGVKTLKSVS